MGSGDTSLWENGFTGIPALDGFFSGRWNLPREFLSNSMKELFVIPAKKTVSEIVRCIDSQFRTTSEGGLGEAANRGQRVIEKSKCLNICQLQTQTSGILGRTFSAGDSQGSPWAIQAVHIGSEEADSDDATSEQTDATELSDQHEHLSSVASAAESDIVTGFTSVDNPLSSDVVEVGTIAGFAAVDNPMFDSSSVESDCDCAEMMQIANDDVKNYEVWENPEFLESVDKVDHGLEEGPAPVTTLMADNPLFQEGFADKRATSLSNPLFVNDCDEGCGDVCCSAASYSSSDTFTLHAEVPPAIFGGRVGLFDSANELLDAMASAESAASDQQWGWHGYDVDCEPPTSKVQNSSSEPGYVSLVMPAPWEHEACVVSMDPKWISMGDAGRPTIDGVDGSASKLARRSCLAALTRKNVADLSSKICCKVVWLIGCMLSVCHTCFPPVVGDYLSEPGNAMGL